MTTHTSILSCLLVLLGACMMPVPPGGVESQETGDANKDGQPFPGGFFNIDDTLSAGEEEVLDLAFNWRARMLVFDNTPGETAKLRLEVKSGSEVLAASYPTEWPSGGDLARAEELIVPPQKGSTQRKLVIKNVGSNSVSGLRVRFYPLPTDKGHGIHFDGTSDENATKTLELSSNEEETLTVKGWGAFRIMARRTNGSVGDHTIRLRLGDLGDNSGTGPDTSDPGGPIQVVTSDMYISQTIYGINDESTHHLKFKKIGGSGTANLEVRVQAVDPSHNGTLSDTSSGSASSSDTVTRDNLTSDTDISVYKSKYAFRVILKQDSSSESSRGKLAVKVTTEISGGERVVAYSDYSKHQRKELVVVGDSTERSYKVRVERNSGSNFGSGADVRIENVRFFDN